MKISLFIILLSISLHVSGQKQDDYKVHIDIENQSVKELFTQIQSQSDLSFSYNSALIKGDSIISFHGSSIPISNVISQVFSKRLEAKIIGNHIVLIESRKYERKSAKLAEAPYYHFKGIVLNSQTQRPIAAASIYDISDKKSVLSDSLGQFDYEVDDYPSYRSFNIAKSAYADTVISTDGNAPDSFLISLKPNRTWKEMEAKRLDEINFIQTSRFAARFVAPEKIYSTQNLQNIYVKRIGQISFVPVLGSNYKSAGIIENNLSINVVAGYNGGVNGLEIGGVLNIINRNMHGVLLSGCVNFVGGYTRGVQAAGILNKSNKKVSGLQAATVTNWVNDTLSGIQLSVANNVAKSIIKGGQITAGFNYGTKKISGFQLSCLYNLAREQLSGAQITCIANEVKKNARGAQIGLIYNNAKENLHGFQLSLVNRAGTNKGLQLGLINISDSSKGAALGLINFVKNGYNAVEVSSNEITYINLTFKSGAEHFYTIYTGGIRPASPSVGTVGFGFGSNITFSDRFALSINATSNYIMEGKDQDMELNLNNRLAFSVDYRFSERMSVFIGPSYNVFLSQLHDADSGEFTSDIAANPFYTNTSNNSLIQMWIGGNLGLRYQF